MGCTVCLPSLQITWVLTLQLIDATQDAVLLVQFLVFLNDEEMNFIASVQTFTSTQPASKKT